MHFALVSNKMLGVRQDPSHPVGGFDYARTLPEFGGRAWVTTKGQLRCSGLPMGAGWPRGPGALQPNGR